MLNEKDTQGDESEQMRCLKRQLHNTHSMLKTSSYLPHHWF